MTPAHGADEPSLRYGKQAFGRQAIASEPSAGQKFRSASAPLSFLRWCDTTLFLRDSFLACRRCRLACETLAAEGLLAGGSRGQA